MQPIKKVKRGDLLTFKAADNRYKVVICTSTNEKTPINFTFAALTYDSVYKPTLEQLHDVEFWGIGHAQNSHFKYPDDQLERMWAVHPEIKPHFLGRYGFIVWRKDFITFRDNFELIGNLPIVQNLDLNGNGSMNASAWEVFSNFFQEGMSATLIYRGQKTFQLKAIICSD